MVTVSVLRFLLILSSKVASKVVDQPVFLQFHSLFFWGEGMYQYQGPVSGQLIQQNSLTQLAALDQTPWFPYDGSFANDAKHLDMQRLLRILQLIAGSGKLSQGLKVKPDDFSNCLLQFIIEEKSCTQSYLYFLQGDVEDICGGKKRNDVICSDPPRKLEATYRRVNIKGSHQTCFCDPMPNIHKICICSYYPDGWLVQFYRMEKRASAAMSTNEWGCIAPILHIPINSHVNGLF